MMMEQHFIFWMPAYQMADGQAIGVSDASLRALLLDWNLGLNSEGSAQLGH